MTNALIIVDVQKDFCEGGNLPVTGGNRVAENIAQYLDVLDGDGYDHIVFTKDWHLALQDNDGHFGNPPDFVNSWPMHCVANTVGAQLHDALADYSAGAAVFTKGQGVPAYSGFEAKMNNTPLNDWLRNYEVSRLDICGLASDYCVQATMKDALAFGYEVKPLFDMMAHINKPGELVWKELTS